MNRKLFHDSVIELPDQAGHTAGGLAVQAAQPQYLQDKMTLHFALAAPAGTQAQLEQLVASGRVVAPAELNTKYGVSAADLQALTAWLRDAGYEIVQVAPDRTSVFARASVADIAKSLDVNMVRVTKGGISYTAAQNAPSLPQDISQSVHAIIGLQPYRQAHKHSKKCLPSGGNRLGLAGPQAKPAGPTPNIANAPPYLVSEVLKAYSADNLGVSGKGQTIAILIDSFPLDTDLQTFWQKNESQATLGSIQKINVSGATLAPPEGEETLDTEWASGIAPGARVSIYASGTLAFADLDRALDRILADAATDPSLRQLSISLGLGETYMSKAEMRTQHQKYLRLAALGVNVFVSSGDAGSNPDNTGHNADGPLQAEYGASDPCVVAVGGTTLVLSASDGKVQSETGWASGGGGKSVVFARPKWQSGAGVPAGKNRLVPDVSLTADPNEGAFLVLNGQVQQIGGTSWSAPVWAGFCALINEARLRDGKRALPFLNPLLYPLLDKAPLRDIDSGSNGAYEAGKGYDMVTGVGVPNVKALIAALP